MPVPRDPFAMAAGRVAPDPVPMAPAIPASWPPPDPGQAVDVTVDVDDATATTGDATADDATPAVPQPVDPDRPVRPMSRDEPMPFTRPEVRAPLHDHHRAKFSRIAGSEITFGPVGRVVVTAVMLVIPAFLLFVSPVWLIFDGIYLVFMFMGLRDVWQPVMIRRAQRTVPASFEIDRAPKE